MYNRVQVLGKEEPQELFAAARLDEQREKSPQTGEQGVSVPARSPLLLCLVSQASGCAQIPAPG